MRGGSRITDRSGVTQPFPRPCFTAPWSHIPLCKCITKFYCYCIYPQSCQCCCLKALIRFELTKKSQQRNYQKICPLLMYCIYIQNCKLFIGTRDTKHTSTPKLYFLVKHCKLYYIAIDEIHYYLILSP